MNVLPLNELGALADAQSPRRAVRGRRRDLRRGNRREVPRTTSCLQPLPGGLHPPRRVAHAAPQGALLLQDVDDRLRLRAALRARQPARGRRPCRALVADGRGRGPGTRRDLDRRRPRLGHRGARARARLGPRPRRGRACVGRRRRVRGRRAAHRVAADRPLSRDGPRSGCGGGRVYGGEDFALAFGGNEMAGYHTGPAGYLGFLVGARHSHLDNAGYAIDQKRLAAGLTAVDDSVVDEIVAEESWRQVLASLSVCFFARGLYTPDVVCDALACSGIEADEERLRSLGAETLARKWTFKRGFGFDPATLRVPERIFEHTLALRHDRPRCARTAPGAVRSPCRARPPTRRSRAGLLRRLRHDESIDSPRTSASRIADPQHASVERQPHRARARRREPTS